MGDDDIDTRPDKLGSELRGAVASPIGIEELYRDVLAFRVAESKQTAPEGVGKRMRRRRRHQHANMAQFSGLLCARRKRPSCHRAADERDELAPPHVLPSVRGSYLTTPPQEMPALCMTPNSAANVSVGSKPEFTASQHCRLLHLD
jgi:hypothetical protein